MGRFYLKLILEGQHVLVGESSFDDFGFTVDEEGRLILTGDGEETLEETMFLVSSAKVAWSTGIYRQRVSEAGLEPLRRHTPA